MTVSNSPSTSAAWAIVLAGGAGSRLGRAFRHCPKPFIPVAGEAFIERVVRRLATFGVTDVVLSLGYGAATAEYYLTHRHPAGPRLHAVREPRPLGTAGGLVHAAERLPDEASIVVVANGDSIVFGDLAAARPALDDSTIDGVICAVEVDDAGDFGTLETDGDGILREFREKQPGRGLVNAGLYLLRRSTIERLRQLGVASLEREAFPRLVADGARFAAHTLTGPLLDIGTPERLAAAEHYLLHESQGRRAA